MTTATSQGEAHEVAKENKKAIQARNLRTGVLFTGVYNGTESSLKQYKGHYFSKGVKQKLPDGWKTVGGKRYYNKNDSPDNYRVLSFHRYFSFLKTSNTEMNLCIYYIIRILECQHISSL